MSNTENSGSVDEQIAALRAEIDRLNTEVSSRTTSDSASGSAAAVNTTPTSGPGSFRAPGDGAKIIGAASDNRGGTVVGYSDGTVKLVGVPAGTDNEPAQPFGSAPEGEYVAFYVDDNGNRYNWLSSDGTTVSSVDNPVQARP